ncbi:MAG: tetratricopeptide repeat protein [Verrucomicrobiales bacterium]
MRSYLPAAFFYALGAMILASCGNAVSQSADSGARKEQPEVRIYPVDPALAKRIEAVLATSKLVVELGMEFELRGTPEAGEIELQAVRGNWRLRQELRDAPANVAGLGGERNGIVIAEEQAYFRARAALHTLARELEEVAGVDALVVSASLESKRDLAALSEFRMGLKRYEIGEYQRALPFFRRSAEMGAPAAQRTLGFIYENGQGVAADAAEAKSWYRQAAAQGEAESIYNLGRMASKEGRAQEAMIYYRRSIELKEDFSMAYNNLGYLLNEAGRNAEAASVLEKAVELRPGYAGSYSNLGIALDGLGRHSEAMSRYQEAIELNPRAADVRVNMGVCAMNQKKFEEAIGQFHRAIHLEPYWHQPYMGLGNIYFVRGEFDLALTAYKGLVKNRPDHPWGFRMLAKTYARQGEFGLAAETAVRGIQIAKGTQRGQHAALAREMEQEFASYRAALADHGKG